MANDPNRDILPVKDSYRAGRVSSEKFDHCMIGKLSRCELEDRFLRLLDEQTQIKKIANCQEEKIKRLGTKLIRLINEKKSGKKCAEPGKESEDLHLRVIELEHENYTLKDKNVVLKQQLASHSRHVSSHRLMAQSNHTSPLASVRQVAPQTQSENEFETPNKNEMSEVQLQEAEAHIEELNNEIKSLHNKIDFLQQNLEKNSLDSQKVKVTENIELIRLQRSLKQQSIQIASLQAQVKNSENSQKMLKDELTRAHKANDEALYLLSEKQNEILNLCSKLEEKNLSRLEETELKQRINDLMIERDCLKERSDFLINAIGAKTEESEKIKELKQLLAEEKEKKEKLEKTLEAMAKSIAKSPRKSVSTEVSLSEQNDSPEKDLRCDKQKVSDVETKEEVVFPSDNSVESEYSSNKIKCNCSPENYSNPEPESETDSREICEIKNEVECSHLDGKHAAEKIKLERELQYLREMLRSQTSRCEAQQAEISRLMYELKLNESKCNETLRKLDMHLTIFERMEMQSRQNDKSAGEPVKLQSQISPKNSVDVDTDEKGITKPAEVYHGGEVVKESPEKNIKPSNNTRKYTSEVTLPSRLAGRDELEKKRVSDSQSTEVETKVAENGQRKRFVDQTFLDSSDEDLVHSEEKSSRMTFMEELQELKEHRKESPLEGREEEALNDRVRRSAGSKEMQKKLSSSSSVGYHPSFQFSSEKLMEARADRNKSKIYSNYSSGEEITVSVLWFKIEPESSLWKNENIKCFFIDFTFLDVNGEETETAESLKKPKNPDELCYFYHTSVIQMHRYRKEIFGSLIGKLDANLIVFKVVSDSENANESNYECEEVGVAVLNVRSFLEHYNKDTFVIPVKNPENRKEVVGSLAVKIQGTSKLINFRNS